ncbi:MAG: hypothetical protein JST80_07305 [Bdellovibrionales bacterium]|nr:hypothetical protein [Bdellovibrionales bacterium]
MINKIKQAAPLKLIHSSKPAKNDLGGQSGEAFSRHPSQKDTSSEHSKTAPEAHKNELDPDESPIATQASVNEQVGLTTVVKEWLEEGKGNLTSVSKSKVSLKYQGESASAKGMLLNKKIS